MQSRRRSADYNTKMVSFIAPTGSCTGVSSWTWTRHFQIWYHHFLCLSYRWIRREDRWCHYPSWDNAWRYGYCCTSESRRCAVQGTPCLLILSLTAILTIRNTSICMGYHWFGSDIASQWRCQQLFPYSTYSGWKATGAVSILASLCISACREAAFKLPPRRTISLCKTKESESYRHSLPVNHRSWSSSDHPFHARCWLWAGEQLNSEDIDREDTLTVRPADSKPSICSRAIFALSTCL